MSLYIIRVVRIQPNGRERTLGFLKSSSLVRERAARVYPHPSNAYKAVESYAIALRNSSPLCFAAFSPTLHVATVNNGKGGLTRIEVVPYKLQRRGRYDNPANFLPSSNRS